MSSPGLVNVMAAGFPLLLLWLKLASAFSRMARSKGVGPAAALIGAFPVWAVFFAIWLMSKPEIRDAAQGEAPDEDDDA